MSVLGESRSFQVTAPHFCAGFTLTERGTIVRSAPIIKWVKAHSLASIQAYCKRKGWKIEELKSSSQELL